ncbi:polysaccharide lyase family 8 super-sandwich domain-containing protein [Coprobacter sp.]
MKGYPYKIWPVFFLFLFNAVYAEDMQMCKKNLIEWHTSSLYEDEKIVSEIIWLTDNGSYIDQSVKELYLNILLPCDTVKCWLVSQLQDGSWPDINYKDRSASLWLPSFHVIRLFHLAKSYCVEKSEQYHQDKVLKAFLSGLRFWCDYENTSTNWWFTEIGINKVLGPALLMMDDYLPEGLRKKALEQLGRSRIGKTGQNRVWLAGNVIYKALLGGNEAELESARNVIASEIYLTMKEGIQPDYSYHLHGPQLQFGNYGLAYALNMTYWACVFRNTKFAFAEEQVGILGDYLLKGLGRVVWNGRMDFSACGRQLFKNVQRGKALALVRALSDISHVECRRSSQYKRLYRSILNEIPNSESLGTYAFYRSDMLIAKTSEAYISIRFSSPRVIATETGNKENLKGYYLGDGVTTLMRDGKEYENVFPVWDWRCLPGITVPVNHGELPVLGWKGYRNGNAFSGVVSDGENGIGAFSLDRDGVTGKKGYFLFGDLLVCLGNCLKNSNGIPLQTTVNQTFYRGNCTVNFEGKTSVLKNGIFDMVSKGDCRISHGGWDYYIFPGQKGRISITERSGSWHEVAGFYDTSRQFSKMFTCVLEDGGGCYAYMAAPTGSNSRKIFSSVEILSRTEKCQAVKNKNNRAVSAVFYEPDLLRLDAHRVFVAVTPALYIIKTYKKGWQITISDPTQRLKTVVFEISGKYPSGIYIPEENRTRFTVTCPQGEYAGSGVSIIV